MVKQGTPTMGGLAIVVAAFVGWLVAHVRDIAFSDQAMIVWVGILAWRSWACSTTTSRSRSATTGASSGSRRTTSRWLMASAWRGGWSATTGIDEPISLVRAGDLGFDVPTIVWVLWAGSIIWATTNAVNVTDGLDGLAGGSALMGFGAFTVIAYWAFRNPDVYGASSTRSTWA